MLVLLNVFGEEWKDLQLLQVMKPGLILKLLKLFMCSKLLCFFFPFLSLCILKILKMLYYVKYRQSF